MDEFGSIGRTPVKVVLFTRVVRGAYLQLNPANSWRGQV